MELVVFMLIALFGGMAIACRFIYSEQSEIEEENTELRQRLQVYEGHTFQRGDKVRKCKGRYIWAGRVMGAFLTSDGQISYVVEHKADEGYVQHIYTEAQLERIA